MALKMFLKTAAEDHLDHLNRVIGHDKDGNPITAIEGYMAANIKNPEKLLTGLFLGGDRTMGGSDLAGRKAWNIVLKGDLAQSNVAT